ncbi:sugar ABC transporter ATP-binding protein [Cryobacterium sp. SO2]|uniref:sugar ABC transporter ATP-binding protein n=1 Tax=Cryobacterium sp. SO2 TaxID=1897060 RepID=UPI00223DC9D2|nr:sugar ABC transporter ATP-binding protein [Cryobacterium sp. SO2]WEO76479.1 sugar ABC transporter ATP-binding protein [Cryobacterium sp. SO2]
MIPSTSTPSERTPEALAPLLKIENLSKTFGGLTALSHVDLDVFPGQIHGLLGENGSGKSTLIKILSGFYTPDAGASAWLRGTPITLPIAPGYFRTLGISFVHQDLGLVPELSVVENLRISNIVAGRGPLINWKKEQAKAAETFARFGLNIDPRETVDRLGDTDRALIAILRAVSELGDHRSLLVLDEPTVFLPKEDTDLLFRVVKELVADGGMSALLVSHDMTEVLEHTDRVTVLRAGEVQAHLDTAGTTDEQLVQLIVGRTLRPAKQSAPSSTDTHHAGAVARVDDLATGHVDKLSFDVAAGEIVGLTGLAGSGFEDALAGIYGAQAATGQLTLRGTRSDLADASPRDSLKAGIVYVPADRKTQGGVGELTVEQNVTLPVIGKFRSWFGLNAAGLSRRADEISESYDIRPRNPQALFSTLSGGNQQKAVLGKWLQDDPQLILLQEPTQGVDIGARSIIFELLRSTAAGGVPIICASSDYDQLAAVCDRVIVLAHGRPHAELTGDDLTHELIAASVITSLTETPALLKESVS